MKKSHGSIHASAECPVPGASVLPPSMSYSAASLYMPSAKAASQMNCGLGVVGNGKLDTPQFMAIKKCSEV